MPRFAALIIAFGLLPLCCGCDSADPASGDGTGSPAGDPNSAGPAQPDFRREAWAEAGRQVEHEGLRVRINRVAIEPVPLVKPATARRGEPEAAGTSKSPLLLIELELTNISPERKLHYIGWASPSAVLGGLSARLQDAAGAKIPLHAFMAPLRPQGQITKPADLIQNEPILEQLVFDPPASPSSELFLELPADNFDGKGHVRLKIPTSAIEK